MPGGSHNDAGLRAQRLVGSERARLDPFVVATGDASPRDQRDLMERPFFSLSKTPRIKPILYKAADIEVQVLGMPEHGMATIWDADVLIWAASQIVEAENHGLKTSRFLRFTPYQLLMAIGRGTGAREYRLLKGAFARLQSTVIATTIRQGEHWRRHQFSWINEWEEMTTHDGRVEGMEFVLPELAARFVLNRCGARTVIARETTETLVDHDPPLLAATIGQRVVFADAAQSGCLASEIDDNSPAAREIAALVTEIDRLGIGRSVP